MSPIPFPSVGAEMGRRSGEARRARRAAIDRLVTATRAARGLPARLTDIEVLDVLTALVAEGGGEGADAAA